MPVRNEARFISSTLGQLLDQEYPRDRFEIIVADGQSDDGTQRSVQDFAARHSNVRLVDNPSRRSSAGRNLGFQLGRGDVFLVVDGHCHIPGRDHLLQVARCLRESGADCLGRPQHLNPPGISAFQESVALARASRLGHGGGSLIYGTFEGFCSPVSHGAAYTRRVLERVGGVDESFDACEDVEFNWRVERAGFQSYTSPGLMVYYYPRESLSGLWRQMVRYGRGRVRLGRKHPASFGLNTLVPAGLVLFLALFAAVLALGTLSGPDSGFLDALALAGWLLSGAYVLVVCLESARICLGNGWEHFARLMLIFPAIHLGLGAGMWMELWDTVRGGRP
ncbi:MAG: glycosyltransferase family 2 protein [Acidobacteriota bacterium]